LYVTYTVGHELSASYESFLKELTARRQELFEESEDRTRSLEGIAARLAHEVKNPLAAVRALSLHVARNTQEDKTRERLEIVSAEAERLQGIVDGFLSFSRGLDDLRLHDVAPVQLAEQMSALLSERCADLNVYIDVEGPTDLSIQADGRKLRQVLMNLVLNAMQASAAGQRVGIKVNRLPSAGAKIEVVDRGAGMSLEVVERIKRPYFTTREGGSGIGVAVARGLVEQHGGTMYFTSEVGKGTTATVELPPRVAPTGLQVLARPSHAASRT
jgi:signal transduction histidine kinase